jgi:hypothetical protein
MADIISLLHPDRCPAGFSYPRAFRSVVEHGLTNLEPWHIIDGEESLRYAFALKARYPSRNLFPFAKRQDNDDIACWEIGDAVQVYLIHDFADSPWEQRAVFPAFSDWLKQALDDYIEFDDVEWAERYR